MLCSFDNKALAVSAEMQTFQSCDREFGGNQLNSTANLPNMNCTIRPSCCNSRTIWGEGDRAHTGGPAFQRDYLLGAAAVQYSQDVVWIIRLWIIHLWGIIGRTVGGYKLSIWAPHILKVFRVRQAE